MQVFDPVRWPVYMQNFPFHAVKSNPTAFLKDVTLSPSAGVVYLFMDFITTTIQKQPGVELVLKSPCVLLPPFFINLENIFQPVFNFPLYQNRYKQLQSTVKNVVLPLIFSTASSQTQFVGFLWIDKQKNRTDLFLPTPNAEKILVNIQEALFAPLTFENSDQISAVTLSQNTDLLTYTSQVNLINIKFDHTHTGSLWSVFYLLKRMGVADWETLANTFSKSSQRHREIDTKFYRTIRDVWLLFGDCIRSDSPKQYMKMFESQATFNFNFEFIQEFQKRVFGKCNFSGELSTQRLNFIIKIIAADPENIPRGSAALTQTTKTLEKKAVQRNDPRDKDVRKLFQGFIPKDPAKAAFPVFRM